MIGSQTTEYNNHSPIFDDSTPLSLRLKYTSVVGTVVIDINATDADPPNEAASRISYSLVGSPFPQLLALLGIADCATVLHIDSNTGVITVSSNLLTSANNFSKCILTIQAEDNAAKPLSTTTALIVVLLPVPIIVGPENVQMEENLVQESVIANISCGEIGLGSGTLSSTLQGTFSRYFKFDMELSVLSIARTFDFETLPHLSFEVDIMCQNEYGLSDTRGLIIEVMNVDDNPFLFENSAYTIFVPENSTVEESVLETAAYDADFPEGILEYFIANSTEYFSINSTTGVIMVAAPLDREYQDQFLLEINARLQESEQVISCNVTVHIMDVNDEVPMFAPHTYIIHNLTSLSEIGNYAVTILAVDPDLSEGGEVTYQLEANNFFILNETTGSLIVNSALQPNLRLTLSVYAMDNGNPQLSSNTTIDIFIYPSPDYIQFTSPYYHFIIPEDEPKGSLIGQVEAFVIDDSNTINEDLQVAYAFSIQSSSTIFSIRTTTGEIHLISVVDYDLSAHQHMLNIQASFQVSNNLTLINETTIMISVLDVNDNPPQFTPGFYARALVESTPAGTSVLTVTATDTDEESNIFFYLEDEDSDPFMVNLLTGVISARNSLTIAQDYHFHVVASDGKFTSQAAVHISVSRQVSLNPTFTKAQYIFNISENVHMSVNNTIQIDIGTVEALSSGRRNSQEFPDVKFRISRSYLSVNSSTYSGSGIDLFEVDETTGVISITAAVELDAESQELYIFYVEVYNNTDGTIFDKATVEVKINDANDNSPIFGQSLYTRVIENSLHFGSSVLTVSASDRDSSTNADIMYSLLPFTLGFAINSTSGEITTENTTLIPGSYHFNLLATDKGSPPQTGLSSVFIAVISAAPGNIEFTQSIYNFYVIENASIGHPIGQAEAIVIESNLTYSTPTLSICVSLDPISGQMYTSCRLDQESQPRYELAVIANAGEYVGTCKVVIDVIDINDNAPVFLLDLYVVVINKNHGNDSSIIQVQATDPDYGENDKIAYTLLDTTGTNMSNTDDYFVIDRFMGHIFLQEMTLPVGDFHLLVQASDPKGLNSTTHVWIHVTELRPPAVFFDSTPLSVRENLDARSLVGHATLVSSGVVVNPVDYHSNLLFVITGGDTLFDLLNVTGTTLLDESGYLFHIDSHSGAIHTRTSLDREAANSHIVTVSAVFRTYGISVETSLNVLVTDDNDMTPQFQPSSYYGMANNTAEIGTVVAAITATDLDTGSNGQVIFEIDSHLPFGIHVTAADHPKTFGEIYVSNSSEFLLQTYSFNIHAVDKGSIPLTGIAHVTIFIDYEPPHFISFAQDTYHFEVTENSPQGTVVGIVSVEPMTPALDGLVYNIQGGNETGSFIIHPTSGIITTTRLNIDRETLANVNLTIVAFLPLEPSLEQAETTVNIFVEDVNDNHPVFSQESYMAVFLTTELSITDKLIQVKATDRDYGSNAEISFNIERISPNVYRLSDIYITQDGSIYTNNTSLSEGIYSFNVSAQDMGTPSLVSSTVVSFRVQHPVPDFINFTKTHYTFHVSENVDPGTHVGNLQLEAIPSYAEPYISFSVDTANFSVNITTGEIQTLSVFDYESEQNNTFIAEALMVISDRIPLVNTSTSASVTIFIINIDDNPPIFTDIPPTLSWLENRSSEEHLYRILSVDIDANSVNQHLEFEILNDDIHDMFRIDNETGDLYIAAELDREERENYTITIQVSDSATPRNSIQRNINFTLLDINDNHPLIFFSVYGHMKNVGTEILFTISDRVESGTVIANISVMDIDAGNNAMVVLKTDQLQGTPFDIEITNYSHPYTHGHILVANTSLLLPGQYTINISAVDLGENPLQSSACSSDH